MRRPRPEVAAHVAKRDEKKMFFFPNKNEDVLFYRCGLCHPAMTNCRFEAGLPLVPATFNLKNVDSNYRGNCNSVPGAAITHFDLVHEATICAFGTEDFMHYYYKPAQAAHGIKSADKAMTHTVYPELNCQLDAEEEYGFSLALQYQNLSIFNNKMWQKATNAFRPFKIGCYASALSLCHRVRDKCRAAALEDLASKGTVVYAALDKGVIYQGMIAFVIVGLGKPIIWRIASMRGQLQGRRQRAGFFFLKIV